MNKNYPIVVGEKVRLRPITEQDTPLIVKWRNSPEVKNNFIYREDLTEEAHNNWLKTKVETGKVIQYIIEDKSENKPVGSVYLRDIDHEFQSAEYGIFIGEASARGKGFGSETAKIFTDFALKEFSLHRIFLRVIAGNNSAYYSYEKAGFVKEGTFKDMVKIDGRFYDIIFMAKFGK